MSDALSDIAADERRGGNFETFVSELIKHLKNPTNKNRQAVLAAAKETDAVARGYFSGPTHLADGLEEWIGQLEQNDKAVWAKLLCLAQKSYRLSILKKMSPFKGRVVAFVDYGIGFVTIKGGIESVIDAVIRDGHNMKIYDCDKYVVSLPSMNPSDSEVFWIDCGILGQQGPRKAKED